VALSPIWKCSAKFGVSFLNHKFASYIHGSKF
jgi:hypothetical protein